MGHAFLIRLGLVALACIALAACGRRGSLEPPPGVPQSQAQQAQSEARQAELMNDRDQPGLIQSPNKIDEEPADVQLETAQRKAAEAGAPRPINAPPVAKKSSFMLDPLL